jgi:uncharacterized protein
VSRRDPLSPLGRITGRPRTVLALWAALALAALPGVLLLSTDNSPEVFYVDGSEAVARFEEMQRLFGAADPVRLAASGERLWTGEGLAWLAAVEARAAAVPGVEDAFGLAGHHGGIIEVGGGSARTVAEGWPPADPDDFRRRALADAIDRNLGLVGVLTGEDTATVLVSLGSGDKRAKAQAVAALQRLVANPPAGVAADVVGLPVLDLALDRSSREIERVFFPLLVALAVALLLASFRDLRGIAVPLVYVAAPEMVLLGALGYLGVAFNLVLAVLPPLLFVIALATAVHLQVRFRDALEDGLRGAEAVRATYEDKGWAVLWTGVTTIVGFGSLAVSRVGPVPTLGLASAAGIALVTIAAFTLYPALLVAFGAPRRSLVVGGRPRAFEHRFRRLGRAWAEWAAGRRRVVLAVALLAVALAAAGLPRLRVESNAVTFLPEEHPARAGIERLEAAGIGVAAAEVFLEGSDDDLGSAAGVAALGELAAEMREIPRVLGAVGPGDLLAEALRRARGAGAAGITPELALGFLRSDPAAGERIRAFVAGDGRAARITFFVPTDGHRELEPLFARAGELARHAFPGARVSVTGELPLLLSTHRRLLFTLGLSLTLTTLAVGAIFRFLLPSTRLTLLALLPNLWPVAMVVGTMAWTGIPLDTATVMVASVVLGLAVDDTIHTLGHFRELAPALGRREAVAGTLERTAPAYVLTGAILAAGFGVCALSDFAPTARFGGLSALAIAFAVGGDLFLLPALLGSTPHSVVGRLGRRG